MATEEPTAHLKLSDDTASTIELFCAIARANGANLSLNEIIQLTSLQISEDQLISAWPKNEKLDARFEIDSGIVYEKGSNDRISAKREFTERARRADSNIGYARRFADYAKDGNTLVLSISGSTSYLSVSHQDDLDYFCISKKDTMWLFLFKALIIARLFSMSDRESPSFCLSYVMDEDYAQNEFTTPHDGLFARDAISTIVLHGERYYELLLKKSPWMEVYFPKLYRSRTSHVANEKVPEFKSAIPKRILNYGLYIVAGSYIRVKSHFLNRKFARIGARERLFKLRIGPDHCIYESENYVELRKMYSGLDSTKKSKKESTGELD